MKFIADVMLGRLAKRMRLLGFDVLYERTLDDNEIIRISLEQQRMILTRDTGLASRPLATQHFLVADDAVLEQLRQVLSVFSGSASTPPLSRCSECNELLIPIAKREAHDVVPQHVYEQQDDFLRCGKCWKIFWRGSHVSRMEMQIKKRPAR